MEREVMERGSTERGVDLRDPRFRGLLPLRGLPSEDLPGKALPGTAGSFCLAAFAGRTGEISGGCDSAALTLALRLVREAQEGGEPAAWIATSRGIFYPPDAGDTVDLASLIVVWAGRTELAVKAADQLARSGSFGLLVLDLGAVKTLPLPSLSRLAGLAKKHRTAIVFLTEKRRERPSLGSLVSIHLHAERIREDDDLFLCRAHALKDKRKGPGWTHEEIRHGPDGLR